MQPIKTSNLYFAIVLIFLMYLLWIMMKPFLGAIIFASIITGSIYPAYNWFLDKTQLTQRLSTILMCFLVAIAVYLPLIYVSFILSKEAITLYQSLITGISDDLVSNFLFGDGYVAKLVKNFSSILGLEINMNSFKN